MYPINNNSHKIDPVRRINKVKKPNNLQCPSCKVQFGTRDELAVHQTKCAFRPKTSKVDYYA